MDGNLPPAPTPPVGGSSSMDLLNLLKFNQSGPQSMNQLHGPSGLSQQYDYSGDYHQQGQPQQPQGQSHQQQMDPSAFPIATSASSGHRIMAPAPSAPDPSGMLAAMMRGEIKDSRNGLTSPTPPAQQYYNPSLTPDNRQYLLNLLNRPKPSQQDEQHQQSSPQPQLQHMHSMDMSQEQQQQQQQQHHYQQQLQQQASMSAIPTPQSQAALMMQQHSSHSHELSSSPGTGNHPLVSQSMSPSQFSHSSIPPGYKLDHPAHEQRIPNYNSNNNTPVTATSNNNNNNSNSNSVSPYGPETTVNSNVSHLYSHPAGSASVQSFGSREYFNDSASPSFPISQRPVGQPDRDLQTSSAMSFQILKKPQSNSPQNAEYIARQDSTVGPAASPDHQLDQSYDQTQTPHTHTTESFVSITPINKDLGLTNPPPQVENSTPVTAASSSPVDHHAADFDGTNANLATAGSQEPSTVLADRTISATGQYPAHDSPASDWQQQQPDSVPQQTVQSQNNGNSEVSMSVTPNEDSTIVPTNGDDVADSWESAEPEEDETRVPEETVKEEALVKVYNFPMRPWISITLHENTEPRAEFRESAVMDVARLRKDFDQVDRNLYTATTRYMAYGMSKAGGLRVIRQDDGKDAKIFADTKDRVFNVSMSVTGDEAAPLQQESILGIGIGGTVYWAKIWQNDNDLIIGDEHPESHGFALPPQSAQEGDAPGGVLKTRARVSSAHPEFFGTGRGKSISIVWPATILKGDYFRPGHDRVVDAEKFASDYSLKINTGKAGKDFVFSQDDTVIVSLDKSGRVKFWDIRQLTEVDPESDPAAPMPLHKNLEINEPLLTLGSTPDGEKAWPTSVLLLDKARPFQKRCALRYMIVGMKQNHTLQLWDLALRKPVQEFNLPHSKESDAVCSVTYHPETGMLVIGHPTRNSIYLAHLSAPKYSFRSLSQADFLTRLADADTIPQPDSTAVISGVREYSFGDRGVLRSLDILMNPASSAEGQEQTLFELYTMHSKGVTCLFIKQADLGWSRDNKVIEPVDALEKKVIEVEKLKPLATIPTEEQRPAPAGRRDVSQGQNANEERKNGGLEPGKVKIETKDRLAVPESADANLPSNDKTTERKPRHKKKAAQAEAQFGNANSNNGNNGGGNKSGGNKVDLGNKANGPQQKAVGVVSNDALENTIKTLETRIGAQVAEIMHQTVTNLNVLVDDTMKHRETDFDLKQMDLLKTVSESLNTHTTQALGEAVKTSLHDTMIPSLNNIVGGAIHSLGAYVQPAVMASLQNPQFTDVLANKVAGQVVGRIQEVQDDFLSNIGPHLAPSLTTISIQSHERVAAEIHERYQDEIEKLNQYRASDRNKIDQLTSLVTRLMDTVTAMNQSQSHFQSEFLKMQRQVRDNSRYSASHLGSNSPHAMEHSPRGPPTHSSYMGGPSAMRTMDGSGHSGMMMQNAQNQSLIGGMPLHHMQQSQQSQQQSQPQVQNPQQGSANPQAQHMYKPSQSQLNQQMGSAMNGQNDYDEDLITMQALIAEGKPEPAIVRWLQTGRQEEIFAKYWCQVSPSILNDVSALVQLSVAATVAQDMEPGPFLRAKAIWLETCVHCLAGNMQSCDETVKDVTPRIMNLVIQSTSKVLGLLNGPNSMDPMVGQLSQINASAARILNMLTPEASVF